MLAGADESADGELSDGSLALAAEAGKPAEAAGAGNDVGLFDDVAEGTPIGEGVAGRGYQDGGGQALAGAESERRKRGVERAV